MINRLTCALMLAAAVAAIAFPPAYALGFGIVRAWDGSAGGHWHNAGNWSPSGGPDDDDFLLLGDGADVTSAGVSVDISRGGSISIRGSSSLLAERGYPFDASDHYM